MLRYLLRRLLLTIPVLLGVATLVFALIHLVPGDPAQSMLGEGASPQEVTALRHSLGLDRPLLSQYAAFLSGVARGDLGTSFRYGTPVAREIGARLYRTAQLAVAAMAVAICIAIPLGILAAVFRGTAVDYAAMTFALAGISMPNFWLGPLLAILFAVKLGWLPVAGTGSVGHLVLPAITLGAALAAILARMTRASLLEELRELYLTAAALAAILARMTRASLLEELRELYLTAARARGLSRTRAILVHAFRNSLIPIVTIVGLQFGAVLTGTIITETIFAWPGVGRLLIQSINFRDYPLVQGCILFISFTYVLVNLLTDLTYGFLDPRIRFD
jgi:ABC-type dipeptide/oligopeptide/nickel transport system permease component